MKTTRNSKLILAFMVVWVSAYTGYSQKFSGNRGAGLISSHQAMSKHNTALKQKHPHTISIKSGADIYVFADPMMAGVSNNFLNYSTDSIAGSLTGYRLLKGIYFGTTYFLNENLGFLLDFNYLKNEESLHTDEYAYFSSARFVLEKAGITGQIIGKSLPVHFSATIGAGLCKAELYNEKVSKTSNDGVYLKGNENTLTLFFNNDVSFPVYKFVYFFGQYEYNFIYNEDFELKDQRGSKYAFKYDNLNLGGSHFRFGLNFIF